MGIGNIGWTEFIVILAIALIFFGPSRLPGIAQTIGKSLREFQKALNEIKSEIAQAGREADTRDELRRILPKPSEFMPGTMHAEPEATKEAEVTMTPRAPGDKPAGAGETSDEPGSPETSGTETKAQDADSGDPDVQ